MSKTDKTDPYGIRHRECTETHNKCGHRFTNAERLVASRKNLREIKQQSNRKARRTEWVKPGRRSYRWDLS